MTTETIDPNPLNPDDFDMAKIDALPAFNVEDHLTTPEARAAYEQEQERMTAEDALMLQIKNTIYFLAAFSQGVHVEYSNIGGDDPKYWHTAEADDVLNSYGRGTSLRIADGYTFNPVVAVDSAALRQILVALTGPSHLVMELKVTMNSIVSSNNPITVLIDQFNAQVAAPGTEGNQDEPQ